VQVSSIVVVR